MPYISNYVQNFFGGKHLATEEMRDVKVPLRNRTIERNWPMRLLSHDQFHAWLVKRNLCINTNLCKCRHERAGQSFGLVREKSTKKESQNGFYRFKFHLGLFPRSEGRIFKMLGKCGDEHQWFEPAKLYELYHSGCVEKTTTKHHGLRVASQRFRCSNNG